MLPLLRKKLKSMSSRNQSLQDILSSSGSSEKALKIEPHVGGIHNTKLILESPAGKQRVQFYNRLDLAVILNGVEFESTTIQDIIDELNLHGYDFTEDDLFISDDGYLTAKPTSLGYVGALDNAVGPGVVCKPELCYAITIDNWAETEEQYQMIYDAIDHIRNTFEAEDPNANPVYVSYVDKYSEDNSVLTVYIYIRFEYNYSNNPPVNGLGGSFKVKFQLPAVDSNLDWYEYDVNYGDDGAEYTLVSKLDAVSYARDIDACLIQIIARPLA